MLLAFWAKRGVRVSEWATWAAPLSWFVFHSFFSCVHSFLWYVSRGWGLGFQRVFLHWIVIVSAFRGCALHTRNRASAVGGQGGTPTLPEFMSSAEARQLSKWEQPLPLRRQPFSTLSVDYFCIILKTSFLPHFRFFSALDIICRLPHKEENNYFSFHPLLSVVERFKKPREHCAWGILCSRIKPRKLTA